MKGQDDMNTNTQSGTSPKTTAVGLDAWMSGHHADPVSIPTIAPVDEPMASSADVGPVNAAEALVLGTVSGARKLIGEDGAELVIDPERGTYHFESTSLKPLAVLLQQPAEQWVPVYTEALKAVREANPSQPLERLRWYAGLVATPGILGRQLNRDQRYKLTRWPETEREFPRHFRIAKAMLNDPATAEEIVTASGMSYEDVVDYINASHAAGRLEATQSGGAANSKAKPAKSRAGRLMATLNKPLFAH